MIFSKKREFCSGKIVCMPFSAIKDDGMLLYDRQNSNLKSEIALFSVDGKLYINANDDASEALIKIFQVLVGYSASELDDLEKDLCERYPSIKSADDSDEISQIHETADKFLVTTKICIPFERNRRELEKIYYGNV